MRVQRKNFRPTTHQKNLLARDMANNHAAVIKLREDYSLSQIGTDSTCFALSH
jgi:hypothetical protein